MSRIEVLYRWLASDTSAEADRTLAAALAHAEPPYDERIAKLLFSRRRESAWTGLIANYDRLSPERRRRLHEPSVLVRSGIAGAIKAADSRSRLNALTLLAQSPCPQLSYLAADVLRDSSPDVRVAAAVALRCHAEQVLTETDRLRSEGGEGLAELGAARAELVRALGEALRTFEVHGRAEVLEVCLWFAKELGSTLWDQLGNKKSSCWRVLERYLPSWNSPRLAGFLLLGLARPAWRATAMKLLDSWDGRAELVALMRNSDLLEDPEVCRALVHIKHPRWFTVSGSKLAGLPRDVRGQLPYWVCHLGFSDAERLHCLGTWQDSSVPELHRSAVFALAWLDTPEAVELLKHVASRPCAMNQFARWYLLGRRLASEGDWASRGRASSRPVIDGPPVFGAEVVR